MVDNSYQEGKAMIFSVGGYNSNGSCDEEENTTDDHDHKDIDIHAYHC